MRRIGSRVRSQTAASASTNVSGVSFGKGPRGKALRQAPSGGPTVSARLLPRVSAAAWLTLVAGNASAEERRLRKDLHRRREDLFPQVASWLLACVERG